MWICSITAEHLGKMLKDGFLFGLWGKELTVRGSDVYLVSGAFWGELSDMKIELVHITNIGCSLSRLELLKGGSFALRKAALSQLSVRFLKSCMRAKDCPSVLRPSQSRIPSFSQKTAGRQPTWS